MMKRRITLSIVLALSVVLVSLTISDSTAKAQQPQRYKFATGVLTPAAGQTLRVTVAAGDLNGDNAIVRFMLARYGAPVCSGTPAVCSSTVDSQAATPLRVLNTLENFSIDMTGDGNGVSVVVVSNNRDVRVNAMVIDAVSGAIVAFSPNDASNPVSEPH